ncbi:MAG TPA: hypothetical protein VMT20_06715 [Terriglobia bacterium]|nr:hypothetical protein [Terriglobia bacterium]
MIKRVIVNLPISSPRGKHLVTRENATKTKLTKKQIEMLEALGRKPEEEIDFSDIPEAEFGSRSFPFRDRHKHLGKQGNLRRQSA